MKPFISRVFFYNRAPFDRIDLSFEKNGISVLTGINGKGKTTVLSYIVDSWYELARHYYANEFKGNENTYFRVGTSIYVPDRTRPSIVYIRYIVDGQNVDYLNIEAGATRNQYDELVPFSNKIPFSSVDQKEGKSKRGRYVSSNINEELITSWLNSNVLTCFPSFRNELPYHITEAFKKQYEYKNYNNYSGYLKNPLIVVSGINGISNWLMDLVLDMKLYDENARVKRETVLWHNVNNMLSSALRSKMNGAPVRWGLGRRNQGATRISVVRQDNSETVYPSIFCMSSGELAVISIFLEILRQADNLYTNIPLGGVQGIVLIDEIDKHLHIKLQKELLPSLMSLLPNVQFIISTHSPFLTMGMAEKEDTLKRTRIIDLDQGGLVSEPEHIDIYQEVYDMMIGANNNYKKLFDELQIQIGMATKPLIITEGKTDAKHIKNAIQKLDVSDLDVDFFEIGDQDWGDSRLESMLENLSKLDNKRKIIGIFDCDKEKFIKAIESEGGHFKCLREGSNVYSFCIPSVNESEYGPAISIEHYYQRKDLLKENSENRRLFLGDEFYKTGNSKDGVYQTRISNIQHKTEVNGVIDEKVYKSDDLEHRNSIAMSKDDFAELVCGDTSYSDGFDLSCFERIIDVIREICVL